MSLLFDDMIILYYTFAIIAFLEYFARGICLFLDIGIAEAVEKGPAAEFAVLRQALFCLLGATQRSPWYLRMVSTVC